MLACVSVICCVYDLGVQTSLKINGLPFLPHCLMSPPVIARLPCDLQPTSIRTTSVEMGASRWRPLPSPAPSAAPSGFGCRAIPVPHGPLLAKAPRNPNSHQYGVHFRKCWPKNQDFEFSMPWDGQFLL